MEPTTILVNALAALLGNRIMAWFQEWTWLNEEEKSKLSGPLADWVAWVLAAASGLLLGWLGQYLGLIDSGQLWQHAGWAVLGSKGLFEIQKAVRNLRD